MVHNCNSVWMYTSFHWVFCCWSDTEMRDGRYFKFNLIIKFKTTYTYQILYLRARPHKINLANFIANSCEYVCLIFYVVCFNTKFLGDKWREECCCVVCCMCVCFYVNSQKGLHTEVRPFCLNASYIQSTFAHMYIDKTLKHVNPRMFCSHTLSVENALCCERLTKSNWWTTATLSICKLFFCWIMFMCYSNRRLTKEADEWCDGCFMV